jgi:putative transposase
MKKIHRTVKLPMPLDPPLLETIRLYTNAYNFVCQEGFPTKTTNGITLHRKTYQVVREYLPSQLAISSRMKATESLKSIFSKKRKKTKRSKRKEQLVKSQKCPQSHCQSIRYDCNSYWLKGNEVSLLSTNGRRKIRIDIPDYYREYFGSSVWKNTSADLILSRQGELFLHIVFEREVPDPIRAPKGRIVGLDRGIINLAVSSLNIFYQGGSEVKRTAKRYQTLRAALQTNGSKSAKRHLKKLSGKEKRFRKDVNHCIAKAIVASLNAGDVIVLETLTGIRSSSNKFRKKERKQANTWAHYQLELFLIYKALAKGIIVDHTDARYTSQKCSHCHHHSKKSRKGSLYDCIKCGFQLNSDLNAARNIRQNYLDAHPMSGGDVNGILPLSVPICYPEQALVNEPIALATLVASANHQSRACGD